MRRNPKTVSRISGGKLFSSMDALGDSLACSFSRLRGIPSAFCFNSTCPWSFSSAVRAMWSFHELEVKGLMILAQGFAYLSWYLTKERMQIRCANAECSTVLKTGVWDTAIWTCELNVEQKKPEPEAGACPRSSHAPPAEQTPQHATQS